MKESFLNLVDLALKDAKYSHMRPVIEKEILHYDILFALSQAGLLNSLTFQGGTSLRLCHNAPRFSEDLDFAGGTNFNKEDLKDIRSCLEDYLKGRYGLLIKVKEPKVQPLTDSYDETNINVAKWQISIQTAPDRVDIPGQRIKLEIANVPSYTTELKSLTRNYDFLPDGYSDILINVQNKDEIMADKLVSLPSCMKYVRHRDIWDLRWLKQQGANPSAGLVLKKIHDYNELDYLNKLENRISSLPEIINSTAFKVEMTRFLPNDVLDRTLNKPGFCDFLTNEVSSLLMDIKTEFMPDEKPISDYRM